MHGRSEFAAAALAAALVFWGVLVVQTPAWALMDSSRPVSNEAQKDGAPLLDGTGDSLGERGEDGTVPGDGGVLVPGRLRLTLGGSGEVEIGFFSAATELAGPGPPRGGNALQEWGTGRESWSVGRGGGGAGGASEREAALYRFSYGTGALKLGGNMLAVGSRFAPTGDGQQVASGEQAEIMAEARGTRALDFEAGLSLAPGLSLTSNHKALKNARPGDEKQGLTTTDTDHTLRWEPVPGSALTASMTEQSEEWAEGLGKPGTRQRKRAVEFKSQFGSEGRHGLRLGLTSVEKRNGDQEHTEQVREAHVTFGPTTRLQLNADYTVKGSDGGPGQTTQSVGMLLRLAPGADLSAAVKRLAPEGGGGTRESTLKLSTGLGAGGSTGRLECQEVTARGDGVGFVRRRKWALTSALGVGEGRTNVEAGFEETRGEGSADRLARTTRVHVDRSLGPRLKLSAERQEQVGGTITAPEATVKSSCELAAELGSKTSLSVGAVSERRPAGAAGWARQMALRHEWGRVRLQAEKRVWRDVDQDFSVTSCSAEAPTGQLPEWAQGISRAHEFSDAEEYLVPGALEWAEMPFAGYRISMKQRRGGAGGGVDTLTFAHRRMVGRRYHLQLVYQEHPEGTEGEEKGLPQSVRRNMLDIAAPLWRGLMVRGGYQAETSLSPEGGRREGMSLGLWGRPSEREQVEATVTHDWGRWEGGTRNHTSVSLLYSVRVSDEHRVHVKLGYGWDEGEPQHRQRESRVSLGYAKPI